SSNSTPEIRQIETDYAPQLARHSDAIRLDGRLFRRIDAVHAGDRSQLGDEDAMLLERYHLDFVLAGARLDEAGQARLRELNERISRVSTTFGQNLHAATEAAALVVDDVAELDGLSD